MNDGVEHRPDHGDDGGRLAAEAHYAPGDSSVFVPEFLVLLFELGDFPLNLVCAGQTARDGLLYLVVFYVAPSGSVFD